MGSILQWGLLSLVFVVDVAYGVSTCFDAASSDFRDCNAGGSSTTFLPGALLLSDCGLEDDDIPDLIACFDSFGRELITFINLEGNDLKELPANLFDGSWPELSWLTLYENNISTLPAGLFSELTNLEALNLANNMLVEIPEDAFDGLTELQFLELGGNLLTELPVGVFDDLEGLQVLDLSGNDNLQCVPQNSASTVLLPDTLEGDASCEEVSANTCRNGFTGFEANGVCCSASCGSCGGSGCSSRSGGSNDCCTRAIVESGVMCDDSGAPPCILSDVEEATTCSNGLPGVQSGDACCSAECGTCGGTGCSGRPGGRNECCVGIISSSGVLCSDSEAAPCIID